jgi:hypothetical protein
MTNQERDLVLRSWLNNEFKQAAGDAEKLRMVAAVMQVGKDRGDPPLHILRVAIASFVAELIAPELLDGLDTWLDRN